MRSYTSTPADDAEQDFNPLEGIRFELDGEVFECQGRISILDTSEMGAAAAAAMDTTDPAGAAIVSEFLKAAFGMAEYRRFRAHQRAHQTPDEVILDIIGDITAQTEAAVAEETGRPTGSPSASSRGPKAKDGRTSRIIGLADGDIQTVTPGGEPADPVLAQERADQAAARKAAGAGRKPRQQDAPARVVRVG